jgi:hypothetical protein
MAAQLIAHNLEFGPYALRFSKPEDFPVVQKVIEAAEGIEESKKIAVYPRDPAILKWSVDNGLVTILERIAANGDIPKLGAPRKIVGLTSIYPLGIDEKGMQRRIEIRQSKGVQPVLRLALDIGSTRYAKEWDLANANGKPSNCFYTLLVGTTVLNAFHKAGRQLGERDFFPDTITANVQNRKDLGTIIERVTTLPLGFEFRTPSDELIKATGATTVGDRFEEMSKSYFELPVSKLTNSAAFLNNAIAMRTVSGFYGAVQHTAHVQFEFDRDFLSTLESIEKNKAWLSERSDESYTQVRQHLSRVMPAIVSSAKVAVTPARKPVRRPAAGRRSAEPLRA